MVVVDEMRLQEEPNHFYRWNQKGNPPVIKIRREKQAVSFYGGLSLKTGRVTINLSSWQDSEQTCLFLDELKKKYQERGKVLVVWDNASWHKSRRIRQWLKENNQDGWLELMFLPPYCPELNPQERVWKALRKNLSQVVGKYDFQEVINRACRFLLTTKFSYRFI